MRYAVKGSNTAEVCGCSGKSLVGLMGQNITPGRVFWLKRVWYPAHASTSKVGLFDASIGSAATNALTGDASNGKTVIEMYGATMGITADGRGLGGYMEFPDPGLKFSTGVCIAFLTSGAATVGSCGGEGYEE